MSKFWKWFLGIALAVTLFASGVFVGSMVRAHMGFAGDSRMVIVGERPIGHAGEDEYGRVEAYGPRGERHGDKEHGGGFEHRGSPLHLLGGLIHLALFFGLIYGAYWLGRRNARLVLDPKAGTPVMSAPAPEATAAKSAPKRAGKKIA